MRDGALPNVPLYIESPPTAQCFCTPWLIPMLISCHAAKTDPKHPLSGIMPSNARRLISTCRIHRESLHWSSLLDPNQNPVHLDPGPSRARDCQFC
jgi:hypothetical protein